MWKAGTPIPKEEPKWMTVGELRERLKALDSSSEVRVITPDITSNKVTLVTRGCGGMVYLFCE